MKKKTIINVYLHRFFFNLNILFFLLESSVKILDSRKIICFMFKIKNQINMYNIDQNKKILTSKMLTAN